MHRILALFLVLGLAHACAEEGFEIWSLFEKPVALNDQDGKPLVTRRGGGHAVPFDWNADGKMDLLLGCKLNLNTAVSELLLVENVGSAAEPRFQWPATLKAAPEGGEGISANCGCKSGGAFELHPTDWNGDGFFDVVISTRSSTKEDTFVLLNTGQSKQAPTFTKGEKYLEIKSHGVGSGCGDWNNDGIEDFIHNVNRYGWNVFPGERVSAGVAFARERAFGSREYKILGHEAYGETKHGAAWFDKTPCAWNFSGRHPAGSKATEIVAAMQTEKNECHINFYALDHEAKTCTFKARLAVNPAAATRVGIGDLNADGCMDVLYTGGLFSKGDETLIYVCYGKVKNIAHDK